MKNFIAHVFIGIGREGHFFTLRQTEERIIGRGSRVVSFHIKNLSQNADEAMTEAKKYAAENGMILKTTRDELPDNLEEIFKGKRNSRAEAKRQREETAAARRAAIEAEKAARRAAQENAINNGTFPFGKHSGKKIAEHLDYVRWLLTKSEEFESGSILEYFANKVVVMFPEVKYSEYADCHLRGAVGTRVTLEGVVKNVYTHNGYYGITRYVTIMTDDRECVVARGSWYTEEGKKVNLIGTIKEKSEYNGQKQTIINRVKEL